MLQSHVKDTLHIVKHTDCAAEVSYSSTLPVVMPGICNSCIAVVICGAAHSPDPSSNLWMRMPPTGLPQMFVIGKSELPHLSLRVTCGKGCEKGCVKGSS